MQEILIEETCLTLFTCTAWNIVSKIYQNRLMKEYPHAENFELKKLT